MSDTRLTFDPPAAWKKLPADVLARIDRLTEDLAALSPDWLLQVFWTDQHGPNQITAEPTTEQDTAA